VLLKNDGEWINCIYLVREGLRDDNTPQVGAHKEVGFRQKKHLELSCQGRKYKIQWDKEESCNLAGVLMYK
jgi:hypothetical protein